VCNFLISVKIKNLKQVKTIKICIKSLKQNKELASQLSPPKYFHLAYRETFNGGELAVTLVNVHK